MCIKARLYFSKRGRDATARWYKCLKVCERNDADGKACARQLGR